MYQDFSTIYFAAQAEQQLIARRAERAWLLAEAELQGQITPGLDATSRLKAALTRVAGVFGRRAAETAAVRPIGRRSAGTY